MADPNRLLPVPLREWARNLREKAGMTLAEYPELPEELEAWADEYARLANDFGAQVAGRKREWSRANAAEHRVMELEAAGRKVIESSVPYLAKYNSFMISPDAWKALNNLVTHGAKELDSLLQRHARGELLTEEEINMALGKTGKE